MQFFLMRKAEMTGRAVGACGGAYRVLLHALREGVRCHRLAARFCERVGHALAEASG
jgi:hypothetical protein